MFDDACVRATMRPLSPDLQISSIMAALWTLGAFEMSRFACRIPFVPRHGTRNVVGQVCECTCVVNVVV